MLLFKLSLIIVISFIFPALIGIVFNSKDKSFLGNSIFGVLLMMSSYCIISIFFAFFRTKLSYATITWLVICILLIAFSLYKYGFRWISFPKDISLDIYSITNYTLFFVQFFVISVFRHSELDDAWYVATATTDWYTNTLDVYNPYTGSETVAHMGLDYFLSRWPDLFASLAQISGIHPTILMHTVFPPILFIFAYAVYYYIGRVYLGNSTKKINIFMILMGTLNLFQQFSTRSPSAFLFLRIWQGKAIMVAVLLPLIFALCVEYAHKKDLNTWFFLLLANLSTCFVSSMGVVLSGIAVGCNAIVYAIKEKRFSALFKMGFTLIPNLVIGILFILLS